MTENMVNEKLEKLIKDSHSKFMTLSAHCPACGDLLHSVFAEDVGKHFQVTLRCKNTDCYYEVVTKVLPQDDFELVSLSNDDTAVFYGEVDVDDDDD